VALRHLVASDYDSFEPLPILGDIAPHKVGVKTGCVGSFGGLKTNRQLEFVTLRRHSLVVWFSLSDPHFRPVLRQMHCYQRYTASSRIMTRSDAGHPTPTLGGFEEIQWNRNEKMAGCRDSRRSPYVDLYCSRKGPLDERLDV
jgi:hypothetical protein